MKCCLCVFEYAYIILKLFTLEQEVQQKMAAMHADLKVVRLEMAALLKEVREATSATAAKEGDKYDYTYIISF